MADLSLIAGNPSSRLQDQYSHLMGIGDVNKLKEEALRVFGTTGVSEKNAAKFRAALGRETALPRVQWYITNFILSGSGRAVLYTAGERRR